MGQSLQLEAPAAAEYLPASHGVHVALTLESEPGGPYSPALHRAPRHVGASAAEYVPAAHLVQVRACAGEYVPGLQMVQFPAPDAAYLPARQGSHEKRLFKSGPQAQSLCSVGRGSLVQSRRIEVEGNQHRVFEQEGS